MCKWNFHAFLQFDYQVIDTIHFFSPLSKCKRYGGHPGIEV